MSDDESTKDMMDRARNANARRVRAAEIAAKKFLIPIEDDNHWPIIYISEFIHALDGDEPMPRWLAVFYSSEYDQNFAVPYGSKRDAMDRLTQTIKEPYGNQPFALVDLDDLSYCVDFKLIRVGEYIDLF